MPGSTTLVESLLRVNLLDELRIFGDPVLVGSGRCLFESENGQVPRKLAGSRVHASGVLSFTSGACRRRGRLDRSRQPWLIETQVSCRRYPLPRQPANSVAQQQRALSGSSVGNLAPAFVSATRSPCQDHTSSDEIQKASLERTWSQVADGPDADACMRCPGRDAGGRFNSDLRYPTSEHRLDIGGNHGQSTFR